jgi:peptide chain release factor 1
MNAEVAPVVTSFPDSEFEVRFHRGTGNGGQRKNKVATCCVITHIPTGITQVSNGRSRIDNELEARTLIEETLRARSSSQNHSSINTIRSTQIGLGQRGDKRRTYRFQDDTIYDQVTGKSATCKQFMKGEIERLW